MEVGVGGGGAGRWGMGRQLFPVRVDPFSKGSQNNFESVAFLGSISIFPLK